MTPEQLKTGTDNRKRLKDLERTIQIFEIDLAKSAQLDIADDDAGQHSVSQLKAMLEGLNRTRAEIELEFAQI